MCKKEITTRRLKLFILSIQFVCQICYSSYTFCHFVHFIFPLENFFTHSRRHRWRAAHFDLCAAFMVIEHWGFLSVPILLCHGASVYNGHLRGHVTLTLNAEQWKFYYLFLRLKSIGAGIRTPKLPFAGPPLTQCATAALVKTWNIERWH